jgi:hypothetical protein
LKLLTQDEQLLAHLSGIEHLVDGIKKGVSDGAGRVSFENDLGTAHPGDFSPRRPWLSVQAHFSHAFMLVTENSATAPRF